MHSLLLLASLLATPAPAAPLPEATQEAAPLIPERPLLMTGEIARLDPYGGWRDDSRRAPELLTLLREQNRWTEVPPPGAPRSKFPAPLVNVITAPPEGGHDHQH